MADIEKFLKEHKQIVLKPLNRCFGSGVMYLYEGDPNTRTIINTMTNNETTLVMVQKYISGVKQGDKRVLTLGDRVLPYTIKKLPTGDDFKFNTHSDNYIVKSELTDSEMENFSHVAKKLNSMGIYMSGLDVIDGKIIEVNVTSPCYFIKEINSLFVVGMLQEGQNLNDIEKGIIIQLDGKLRSFIQKSGRVLRAEHPEIFIIYVKGTQDETYLKNALEGLNPDYITYYEDYNRRRSM
jgi:glutathione synthase